jgi:DNA-binding MarR family transcriptional regulator
LSSRVDDRLIGALLRVAFQATVAAVERALVRAGFDDVRPAHFPVFQHMEPGGVRATVLAERAQITKQSMGYLVDYLAARGYVERVPDPADRRAQLVRLTDRGQALARCARGAILKLEADWARRLGADELEKLRGTLRRIAAFVERGVGD